MSFYFPQHSFSQLLGEISTSPAGSDEGSQTATAVQRQGKGLILLLTKAQKDTLQGAIQQQQSPISHDAASQSHTGSDNPYKQLQQNMHQ